MRLGLLIYFIQAGYFMCSGWFFPSTVTGGMILLAAATIGMALLLREKQWTGPRTLAATTVCLVLSGSIWIVIPKLAAAWHYPGPLTIKAISLLFRLLGVQTGQTSPTSLGLLLDNKLVDVAVTTEGLGLLFLVAVISTWLFFGVLIGETIPDPYLSSLSAFVFLIVRFCIVVLMTHTYRLNGVMWDAVPYLVSFLPFVLLLGILPCRELTLKWTGKRGSVQLRVGCIIACYLLLGFFFQAVHLPCHGKISILIDDSHSEWEWSTIPYDTSFYGKKSNYNYYCLRSWLGHFGSVEVNERLPLDQVELGKYDILLLKTPTQAYSLEEKEAINIYVRSGGGLLILGDHTDFLGTSTYLNELLSSMCATRLSADATYTLRTSRYHVFYPMLGNTVQGGLRRINFLTSASVSAPLSADYLIVDGNLGSDDLDYSNPGFFGDMSYDLDSAFGFFASCVGTSVGKGKILLFGDSTIFSNFSMFYDDNAHLLYNFVQYLLSPSWFTQVRRIAIPVVSLVALTLLLTLFVEGKGAMVIHVILIGIIATVLGGITARRFIYADPYEQVPRSKVVAFERSISQFDLPSYGQKSLPSPERAWDTFYIWSQRLGLIPLTVNGIDRARQVANTLVFINPDLEAMTTRYWDELGQFLFENGHILVVLPHGGEPETLSDRLPLPLEWQQVSDYLYQADVYQADVARGSIFLALRDFSRLSMGYPDDEPDQDRLLLFSEVFQLLSLVTTPRPPHADP